MTYITEKIKSSQGRYYRGFGKADPLDETPVEEPVSVGLKTVSLDEAVALDEPEPEPVKKAQFTLLDGMKVPAEFAGFPCPLEITTPVWIGTTPAYDRYNNPIRDYATNQPGAGMLHLPTYNAVRHPRVLEDGTMEKRPDVLFIATCAVFEEVSNSGNIRPFFTKGPAGNLFRRNLLKSGFKEEEWSYTSLVRYCLPKFKPKRPDINWSKHSMFWEILALKPKIVVCLGKPQFDLLVPDNLKLSVSDVQGAFFNQKISMDVTTSDDLGVRTETLMHSFTLYPMDTVTLPLLRPEYIERALVDLATVREYLDTTRGVHIEKVEQDYCVLSNATEVGNWANDMVDKDVKILSVDAEWSGKTFVDGKLRSLQACWAPGKAAYIKLMDDTMTRTMDVPDIEVGNAAAPILRNPDVKFIGHNIAADFVWMEHHLGVNTYKRAAFDTMFAQQVIDEYADLKLERLALKYTDLGRYDIDLTIWKKLNGLGKAEGYGRIPDEILIPYALKDVDAVYRMYPILTKKLIEEGGRLNRTSPQGPAGSDADPFRLVNYFYKTCMPFVTDCFVSKMMLGMPVDKPYLDIMRETFHTNLDILKAEFVESIVNESNVILLKRLCEHDPLRAPDTFRNLLELKGQFIEYSETEVHNEIIETCKQFFGVSWFEPKHYRMIEHWLGSDSFNFNSVEDLKRWLFDVKGLTPFKTTKKDGIQMAWEKVLRMPKERQAEFSPAADKQTLMVHSENDGLVAQVLELKAVNTMCKTFLRQAVDGEEEGIHSWICSDGRIHANFACTETGRPRTWSPNILNWPKSVAKTIERAFKRINEKRAEAKRKEYEFLKTQAPDVYTPQFIEAEIDKIIHLPVSLRSAIKAPEGCCFTDADLVTAEVVGLGYLSNDTNLVAACEAPDEQYGLLDNPEKPDEPKAVRYQFIKEVTNIPEANNDSSVLYKGSTDDFLRDEHGNIRHPKRDVHWQMAETFMGQPREKLSKDIHRGAGKVGMFAIPYGATGALLERNIEVLTGVKPAPGTGESIVNAYKTNFPRATSFLENQEYLVNFPGFYQSRSGRIRRFKINEIRDLEGLTNWARQGIESPLKRESRNYPLQEIVAATMARAHIMLLERFRSEGMKSRPMILLYDALTILGPIEERHAVRDALQWAMSDNNVWQLGGDRSFSFDIDVEFTIRWATKPTKEEKMLLE